MGAYKIPSPDGFPPAFFQIFWDIVEGDLVLEARDFFNSGKILKQLNHTFIAFVSKVVEPQSMTDFRPISLCNTIYKISKIW